MIDYFILVNVVLCFSSHTTLVLFFNYDYNELSSVDMFFTNFPYLINPKNVLTCMHFFGTGTLVIALIILSGI